MLPALLKNITLLDELRAGAHSVGGGRGAATPACVPWPRPTRRSPQVLTYHVASGNVSSSQLKDGELVPTLLKGKDILVNIFTEPRPTPHTVVTLDHHALVTLPDNFATNG